MNTNTNVEFEYGDKYGNKSHRSGSRARTGMYSREKLAYSLMMSRDDS